MKSNAIEEITTAEAAAYGVFSTFIHYGITTQADYERIMQKAQRVKISIMQNETEAAIAGGH